MAHTHAHTHTQNIAYHHVSTWGVGMGVVEAISGCFKEMWWIAKEEQLSISEWVSGLVRDGFWVSGPFLLSLAQ